MSFEWAGLYTPTLLTSVSKALKTMLATQNQLILANISHLWAIQNKTKQKVQSSKSVWRSLLLYHPWERNLFGSPMICLSPSVRLKFFPEDTFFSLDAEKQTKEASERRVWFIEGKVWWECFLRLEDWSPKLVLKAGIARVIGGERCQQLLPESGLILMETRELGT